MIPRPSEPEALYADAVVQWRDRRRDAAIKLIDEAIRLRPDFAAAPPVEDRALKADFLVRG